MRVWVCETCGLILYRRSMYDYTKNGLPHCHGKMTTKMVIALSTVIGLAFGAFIVGIFFGQFWALMQHINM